MYIFSDSDSMLDAKKVFSEEKLENEKSKKHNTDNRDNNLHSSENVLVQNSLNSLTSSKQFPNISSNSTHSQSSSKDLSNGVNISEVSILISD